MTDETDSNITTTDSNFTTTDSVVTNLPDKQAASEISLESTDEYEIDISPTAAAVHYNDYWVFSAEKGSDPNGPIISDIILTDAEMKNLYNGMNRYWMGR